MKIVFDSRWIKERSSGIGVYSREMMRRLPALLPEVEFVFLFQSEEMAAKVLGAGAAGAAGAGAAGAGAAGAAGAGAAGAGAAGAGADCAAANARTRSLVVPFSPMSAKNQLLMPKLLREIGADIFHSPNYMIPYFAFKRGGSGARAGGGGGGGGGAADGPRRAPVAVANIHDVIPLVVEGYAPKSLTSRLKFIYKACLRQTVARSAAVITGSQSAKDDLARALALPARRLDKTTVIYDGADTCAPAPAEAAAEAAARQDNAASRQDDKKASRQDDKTELRAKAPDSPPCQLDDSPPQTANYKLQTLSAPDTRETPDTPDAPETRDRPRRLLYVGRMDPYKNVAGLVRAFADARKRVPFPLQLTIAGASDPRYPEAADEARRLGVADSVAFADHVPDAELARLYAESDLLAHFSSYEGFGLPIVEAMRAGLPVICTDGGSQPEVAGAAAEIVKAGDELAMAGAIADLLSSPEKLRALRAAGPARAAAFTWDKCAADTAALLRKLL